MTEFAFNNFKNVSISHIPFKLNCGYHLCVSFKDEYNTCSKSFLAKKRAMELRELMNIYCQNLLHVQNLQKQANDKEVKPWSYVPGKKVSLNSKYIKRKKNWKLKAKFFGPFQVFYPVGKQVYKLELLIR